MNKFVLISFSLMALFLFNDTAISKDSRIETIDQTLSRLQVDEDFNGNVLIYEKGEVLYEKSFGFKDYDKQLKLNENSLFNIASVSKTITATAIMQLVERRRLRLSDPVTKYLPEIKHKNITIRNLLTHTSGLTELQKPAIRKSIEGKGVNNKEFMANLQKLDLPLEFEPGTKYSYSNTNYISLAMIIEKVTGMSFPDYVQTRIFQRAGMKAYFFNRGVIDERRSDIVGAFYRDGFLRPKWVNAKNLGFVKRLRATIDNLYGSGQIFTTARDLLKFHKALQSGRLLKRRTLERMYRPNRLVNGKDYRVTPVPNFPSRQGLGWEVAVDNSGGRVVYHPGGEPATRSYFMRNVDEDRCVIILTNNNLTNHRTFTFPMRVMQGDGFILQKKSLAFWVGKTIEKNGIEKGEETYEKSKNSGDYRVVEDEFNVLGYELLEVKKIDEAIVVFKMVTRRFPDSWNAWDSLAEGYLNKGDKKRALEFYKKSVKLNPKNVTGAQAIKKLEAEL